MGMTPKRHRELDGTLSALVVDPDFQDQAVDAVTIPLEEVLEEVI